MNEKTALFQGVNPTKDNWLAAGSGIGGISYLLRVTRNFGRTEFYLYKYGGEEGLRAAFHELHSMKSQIENELGLPVIWDEMEGTNSYRMVIDGPGNIFDPDQWDAMIEHMVESIVALERVMPPFIEQTSIGRRSSR